MKKRWLILFLFCAGRAFAAGGTCPSGANYLSPTNPAGPNITLATMGVTSCFYIAANGSDSNDGLSEAAGHPWLHAPGMPNCSSACSSTSVTAGEGFIFRGGDTWHLGNSSAAPYTGGTWNWVHSGTSSNPIYIGVDQSWFSGLLWARPILNGDNPLNGTTGTGAGVTSCTYGGGGANLFTATAIYYHFDNFEMTGMCWTSSGGSYIYTQGLNQQVQGSANPNPRWIEDNYIHGWTHTKWGSGNAACNGAGINGSSGEPQNGAYYGMIMQFNVIDGSDSDYESFAWSGCQGDTWIVRYNVVRYNGGDNSPLSTHQFHDNLFEWGYNAQDGVSHTDWPLQNYGSEPNGGTFPGDGTPNLFYNNIVRHMPLAMSSVLWQFPQGSTPDYDFNNIFSDYEVSTSNYNNVCQGGCGKLVLFNNTSEASGAPSPNGCVWCADSNGPTITATNNHWITSGGSGSGITNTTGTTTETNSIYQTVSTANGQGYTVTNDWRPTASTNSTVSASGTNLTSTYCQLFDALGQAACQAGITGVSYNSTNHTVVYPAIASVARPSSGAWNVGAYQFSSAITTPIFSPAAGGYLTTQTVAITSQAGATICYTTDGSTPTATTPGTCSHGTTLANGGTISVAVAETVNAIGTESGLTNSSVGTAYYEIQVSCGNTIPWNSSTGICQQISGSQQLNTAYVSGVAAPSAWTVISRHGEYAQDENECNVPDAIAVASSDLTITTSNASRTCGNFNTDGSINTTPASWPYTTGDIQWNTFNIVPSGTPGTGGVACGGTCIVSLRMKVPNSNTGTWPGALWLLGTNCQTLNKFSGDTGVGSCPSVGQSGYGEIDMGEFSIGSGRGWPENWGAFNTTTGSVLAFTQSPINDGLFHNYSLSWTASSWNTTVDGTSSGNTYSGSVVPTTPLFAIFQTQTAAAGAPCCGSPNNANLPAQLVLDWIHVCGSPITTRAGCEAVTSPATSGVLFYDDFAAPLSPATAPTCSPGNGNYASAQTVTCTNPNSGTTDICYTTDGSTPVTGGDGATCSHGTLYTTTIAVSVPETLEVVAGTSINSDSSVTAYGYTFNIATPVFSPSAGHYSTTQTVTITAQSGATICYTIDGSTPTATTPGTCSHGTSLASGGTISVAATETINALGTESGLVNSSVATAAYTIGGVSYVSTGCSIEVTGESSTGSFTFSCTPQAINDAVLFFLYCHPTSGTISATSLTGSGWSFTQLIADTSQGSSPPGIASVFGALAPNTSSTTFTATFTGASNCTNFNIVMGGEFSGNSTVGGATTFNAVGSSGGTASTCNQTAANVTPPSNNEGLWFACLDAATAATSPYIAGENDGAGQMTEYQLLSGGAGTAQTPAFTSASGAYIVQGVAIAPASGSPPAGTGLLPVLFTQIDLPHALELELP